MVFKETLLALGILFGGASYTQNSNVEADSTNKEVEKTLSFETRIIPNDENSTGHTSPFQRLSLKVPYDVNDDDGTIGLTTERRLRETGYSFTTLSLSNPGNMKNTDFYFNYQGTSQDGLMILEYCKSGKISLTEKIDATYLFNPGIGLGKALEKYYDTENFMQFAIMDATLNFKNEEGKSNLLLSGGWLPLGDLLHGDSDVKNFAVGSITVANRYMVSFGSNNGNKIAHLGYLENDNFGYYTTIKFDENNKISSTWTNIGFGDTQKKDGEGFFTNANITSPTGPVLQQTIEPFFWDYHKPCLSNAAKSLAINTHHTNTEEGKEHKIRAVFGLRDTGLPFSIGVGTQATFIDHNYDDENTSVSLESIGGIVSFYTDQIEIGPVKLQLEANYLHEPATYSIGSFSGYVNATVDLDALSSGKNKKN